MRNLYIRFIPVFVVIFLFILLTPPQVFAVCGVKYWSCVGGSDYSCKSSNETNPSGSCSTLGQIQSGRQCANSPSCSGSSPWNCWNVICTCVQDACAPTDDPNQPPPGPNPQPTDEPRATTMPTPIPTMTSVPTVLPSHTPLPTVIPTPIPHTMLSFTVYLHGIGNSGDNANAASSLSNKNPLHPQRNTRVEIYNSENVSIASYIGTMTYASASGTFQGTADLGTSFSSGIYIISIKTDQFLRARFTGIQSITPGQSKILPEISLIAGDVIDDNRLNILDYNTIYGCYTGTNLAARACNDEKKVKADLTDDGTVNQYDYNRFIRELSVQQGA